MIFRNEAAVRRMVKREADKAWWIEGKSGSSAGLPDALVSYGGRMVACELKLATPRLPQGWTVEASPAQISTLRGLRSGGLNSWLLAGIAGTDLCGALWDVDRMIRLTSQGGIGGRVRYLIKDWDYEWSSTESGLPNVLFYPQDLGDRGATEMTDWRDMDSAPKIGPPFQAEIPGNGKDNVIAWVEGLLDGNNEPCGAWMIMDDQEPPDSWTDGVCWEKNEDGEPSVKPTRWKPL